MEASCQYRGAHTTSRPSNTHSTDQANIEIRKRETQNQLQELQNQLQEPQNQLQELQNQLQELQNQLQELQNHLQEPQNPLKRTLKLQTARFRTLFELQTRDLVQNHRLDVLYHPVGVLDLEKDQKPSKNPKNCFSGPPQKSFIFSFRAP